MTQKLCHLKLRPREWVNRAKDVCAWVCECGLECVFEYVLCECVLWVCVCARGVSLHREYHVNGTSIQHTHTTEAHVSWNNTWLCEMSLDILFILFFKMLVTAHYIDFTVTHRSSWPAPLVSLDELFPQHQKCLFPSLFVPLVFLIVIKEFNSCLLPIKYERRGARIVIFRKTKLKVWERLVGVKHLGTSLSDWSDCHNCLSAPVTTPGTSWSSIQQLSSVQPLPWHVSVPSAFLYSFLILVAALWCSYCLYSHYRWQSWDSDGWCILLRMGWVRAET